MRCSTLLVLILLSATFYGCLGPSTPSDNETAVQKYMDTYYESLGNGTYYMESGNYEQAQYFFTRARLDLSYSLDQLTAGCEADIYSKEYCEAERADIQDCKMEAVTFYENYNKMLDFQNPGLNCNPVIESLRLANMRCTTIHSKYGSLLDEWRNIAAPAKLRAKCNITEG